MTRQKYANLFLIRSLTTRQKYAVLVSILYAVGKRNEAFMFIKRSLSETKLSRKFFSELFLHLSLLLGFPTMLDGLKRLSELGISHRQNKSAQRDRVALRPVGLKALARVYGNQTDRLLSELQELHPEVAGLIVENAYGKIISRKGLTLQERELINVVVLTIQRLERQLYSHIRGAMRVGLKARTLEMVLRETNELAHVNVDTPLKILAQLTSKANAKMSSDK